MSTMLIQLTTYSVIRVLTNPTWRIKYGVVNTQWEMKKQQSIYIMYTSPIAILVFMLSILKLASLIS